MTDEDFEAFMDEHADMTTEEMIEWLDGIETRLKRRREEEERMEERWFDQYIK